ncbi:hypothetical protein ACFRQM_40095 [Streptomyces sp. NPDC056831]|uniref:hypothetical protein n=1 Tax=Streptomyces sp. NPDC056831 TaxID=3345954 RepID=UPI0036B5C353
MSLSVFKRRLKAGQHVTVVNHMYTTLSGERTVHEVQTRGIKTLSESADSPWFVK